MGENVEFGLLGCADRKQDLATLRGYLSEDVTLLIESAPNWGCSAPGESANVFPTRT
jgi:hypothetical protein